ncbi:hypothetical protein TNIN_24873 [Trichonephila inaurata madagascariensis]|uniref:Uncharacterized protein n=1 Tax=Trichonephila inaurata madagascariensis TaxID=2747483 RepID=A0A8X6Y5B7_9ARAC|nr:hypothetical protein TNIN_24873 [Trichonephila inaurata madagascariensis]
MEVGLAFCIAFSFLVTQIGVSQAFPSVASDSDDKLQRVIIDSSEGMNDDEDDGAIGTDPEFVMRLSKTAGAMSDFFPELYNRALEVSHADTIGLSPISEDAEMRGKVKNVLLNGLMAMTVASVAYGNMMRSVSSPVEDFS